MHHVVPRIACALHLPPSALIPAQRLIACAPPPPGTLLETRGHANSCRASCPPALDGRADGHREAIEAGKVCVCGLAKFGGCSHLGVYVPWSERALPQRAP